jgi:hypothetical protein
MKINSVGLRNAEVTIVARTVGFTRPNMGIWYVEKNQREKQNFM